MIVSQRQTEDHPRLCGEKNRWKDVGKGGLGSPPPMRGKAFHTKNSLLLIRITPAYAGKSIFNIVDNFGTQDHPRLCGEKFSRKMPECYEERITPAYAGKRTILFTVSNPNRDHPRLCGEKAFRFKFKMPLIGSPPPMRGKAKNTSPRFNCDRITPAYAGKSTGIIGRNEI